MKYHLYDIMDPFEDEKLATVLAATKKMSQVACRFVFKHSMKENKSRLQPYGVAIVTVKQVVVPSQGSYQFT